MVVGGVMVLVVVLLCHGGVTVAWWCYLCGGGIATVHVCGRVVESRLC